VLSPIFSVLFVPGKPIHLNLLLAGKARIGFSPTHKLWTMLERLLNWTVFDGIVT